MRRTPTAVVALLMGLIAAALPASAGPTAVDSPKERRLRPLGESEEALVRRAVQRSPTLARLVAALDDTDLIVYVRLQPYLPVPTARTSFLVATAQCRYLMLSINPSNLADEQIALLGHELRHTLEIAAAPQVRSEQTLEELYREIGHRSLGEHNYETFAAREAGARVREEVSNRRLARVLKTPPDAAAR